MSVIDPRRISAPPPFTTIEVVSKNTQNASRKALQAGQGPKESPLRGAS